MNNKSNVDCRLTTKYEYFMAVHIHSNHNNNNVNINNNIFVFRVNGRFIFSAFKIL